MVPEGTATADRMIVEQSFWETLALEAPAEPENVQLVARLARLGASVMAGSATGEAATPAANAASTRGVISLVIVTENRLSFLSIDPSCLFSPGVWPRNSLAL